MAVTTTGRHPAALGPAEPPPPTAAAAAAQVKLRPSSSSAKSVLRWEETKRWQSI